MNLWKYYASRPSFSASKSEKNNHLHRLMGCNKPSLETVFFSSTFIVYYTPLGFSFGICALSWVFGNIYRTSTSIKHHHSIFSDLTKFSSVALIIITNTKKQYAYSHIWTKWVSPNSRTQKKKIIYRECTIILYQGVYDFLSVSSQKSLIMVSH